MFVRCFTIIKDPILNHKINHFINQTPFLTSHSIDDKTINIVGEISPETDLIILEATTLSLENLRNLQLRFRDKFFIILSDLMAHFNLQETKKTIILSKDVTYKDFVEGLSSIAENKTEYDMQRRAFKNFG